MTAEQKIREALIEPQYEGPNAIHWVTGGGASLPDAWVTFTQDGDQIVVRCAGCKNILGYLPADRDATQTHEALKSIRLAGHELHKPENWPQQFFAL